MVRNPLSVLVQAREASGTEAEAGQDAGQEDAAREARREAKQRRRHERQLAAMVAQDVRSTSLIS